MKITREVLINGVSMTTEYELTGIELERCYNEYRATHTADEVRRQLRDSEENYDVDSIPDDVIGTIVDEVHSIIDESTFNDTVLIAIQNNANQLEQYKPHYKVFTKRVRVTLEHEYTIRAKDECDAEDIFDEWSQHHMKVIVGDLTEDVENDGDFDWDSAQEDPDYSDPDNADIMVDEYSSYGG